MKKNKSNNHLHKGFIEPKLLNTLLIIGAIVIFLGPILFLGSLIMKIIAVVLLINLLPSLFKGNPKNLTTNLLFALILVLIIFKRSVLIPIVIILALILLNKGIFKPKTKDGTYKFTNSGADFNRNEFTQNSFTQKTSTYTEPKDPFSYRKRNSEIIDVEYEDWEPETKGQSYTNPNVKSKQSMDYSYSGNISKEENMDAEESEADCCDKSCTFETQNERGEQKVYIGSITKTIHQDSLQPGDNELTFICKLGDLNLIIDSRIETDINCSIKAGEVRIGDEKSNGFNQKLKRSWSPTSPSNKRLKLNCEVGLGEIRIRHKKLY